MKTFPAFAVLAAALILPAAARAEGSRQPAAGAHMSTYVTHPDHDPRSLYWQRKGSGQVLGAPMMSERAGAHGVRQSYRQDRIVPYWANGPLRHR